MNLHTNLDLTPNLAQNPEKTREKVAEITKNPKTDQNIACYLYLHDAIKQIFHPLSV